MLESPTSSLHYIFAAFETSPPSSQVANQSYTNESQTLQYHIAFTMSDGVQDPNMSEQMSTDTPMEEQVEKGKGKAPTEQMHDEDDDEDESEEDEEVRQSHSPLCEALLTVFTG